MARVSIETAQAVVAGIYEAAYDRTNWPAALSAVGELFNASRTCIVQVNIEADGIRSSSAVASFSAPEFETVAANEAALRDPWPHAVANQPPGLVVRRRDIVDEETFRTGELWLGWMKPLQMDESASTLIAVSPKTRWSLDVSRMDKFGAFRNEEIELLQKLVPHVMRAGQIGEQLETVRSVGGLYANLPFAIVIVTPDLTVLHMNESAETQLQSGDAALELKNGKVGTPNRDAARRLEQLVIDSCRPPLTGEPAIGGNMIVSRGKGDADAARLLVSVAPLATSGKYGIGTMHCAAIMFRRIDAPPAGDIHSPLTGLFGLTPAEARLAAALAAGKPLAVAATEQNIKTSTARYYLETIFRKTGTHRQGELVALLTANIPILNRY